MVAANLVRDRAADEGGDRVLRRGERDHHALLGVFLRLYRGQRARRAGNLHHGGGTLHLQRAHQDQPSGHRIRRLGPPVPRVAAADRASVRGATPGERGRGRLAMVGAPDLRTDAGRSGYRVKPDRILKHGVLLLATLLALVPTLYMLMTALKSEDEYTVNKVGLPRTIVFD